MQATTNIFEGAVIGEDFITAAGDVVRFLQEDPRNHPYRYRVRREDGFSYHNAAGETPLGYDPGGGRLGGTKASHLRLSPSRNSGKRWSGASSRISSGSETSTVNNGTSRT